MYVNELWIMVIGGESDEERMIAKSNNMLEIRKAVEKYESEVIYGTDKYFELLTNHQSYTFYNLDDFDEYDLTDPIVMLRQMMSDILGF